MPSKFSFLKQHLPELEILGGLAEQYVFADPPSCVVKLRAFGEELTKTIYYKLGLSIPEDDSFLNLLTQWDFQQYCPKNVLTKLHLLRKYGNRGAHGQQVVEKDALDALREAHDVGSWITLTLFNGKNEDITPFTAPKKTSKSQQWEKDKQALLSKLSSQEFQIEKLLSDLNTARTQARANKKSEADLRAFAERGNNAANALDFDEMTTRRLMIEKDLASVGWNVGANGKNTPEVTQETEVQYQGTTSGIGYADFVLWDDREKPLAIIEVKKTSKDPDIGKKQAFDYAAGLEQMTGQRPIIIFTNGYDTFIWNDAANEPPRKIYGFYSKDSLEYLLFQRHDRKPLQTLNIDTKITDRFYQIEAIKRVTERFDSKYRKALLVQATGTGKTRVAVSLSKALLNVGWVKRILFLCDRRELRKQAKNVFEEYIPSVPLTVVTAKTAQDRDKRIYLATYPAMLKIYQTFDVGFFDLIIADESHRSIYNVYSDLFLYFDALQIGLTATPVHYINRNTFQLFDCEDQDPTASFSYEEAINHQPPYLVPYKVYCHKTRFMRDGIKYAEMTREQQLQLEEQVADAEDIEFEDRDIDKLIFNKDTNREIIRNLMDNGIKDKNSMLPGKSIIFARSHKHAMLLRDLFDDMYPQYGGKFCEVIDNYDPRAEQLIDDFKGIGNNPDLTIAISVDMLDTGIDVPEIVNLVFAKPVKSFVKFSQMIGRGTRLCPNLFGSGKDKKEFYIFDHWSNFEWFDMNGLNSAEPNQSPSLLHKLFEQRLQLAHTALEKSQEDTFQLVLDLIYKDINALDNLQTIAVKEKWRSVKSMSKKETLHEFSATTQQILHAEIAPLMTWRNIRGVADAFEFDLLVCLAQKALLQVSSDFDNYKDDILNHIAQLQKNLLPVREKGKMLQQVQQTAFWQNVTVQQLEEVRLELRGIMKYRRSEKQVTFEPVVTDVSEVREDIQEYGYQPRRLEGLQMVAYKERVQKALDDLFEENPTLQKIKQGKPVDQDDLESLVSLVLMQHPDIDLKILEQVFPDTAGHLDFAIRRVIGLDAQYVDNIFKTFVQAHPSLTADQVRFISLLKNHISRYGAIQPERLYDSPFTSISSDGPDGIFNDEQMNDLLRLVQLVNLPESRQA